MVSSRIPVSVTLLFLLACGRGAVTGATWYVDDSVWLPGDGSSWQKALKTIQSGIDKAENGDTVMVSEGTYIECIHFDGKSITLQSKDPLDTPTVQNTIIDGNAAGTVITFSGTEDASCILSGFTIRKGKAIYGGGISGGTGSSGTQAKIQFNRIIDNFADFGGGIRRCDGIIQNNRIESNTAYWGGGLDLCNGTIRRNTIRANEAAWTGGGLRNCGGTIERNDILLNVSNDDGGGVSGCHGTISENTIRANSATDRGGGLYDCDGLIRDNTIGGNSAGGGGGLCDCQAVIGENTISENTASEGGGLQNCGSTIEGNEILENTADEAGGGLSGCHGTVKENTIAGNSATDRGGGLNECNGPIEQNSIDGNSCSGSGGGFSRCGGTIKNNMIRANEAGHIGGGLYDCDGDIRNNLITKNSAVSATGDGGALAYCDGQVTNNTIVENGAGRAGGAMVMCWATTLNCIFWENTSPQFSDSVDPKYSCIQDWTGEGEGNISDPPGFVDFDAADYRLSETSPCIDAGRNETWMWTSLDLDGGSRIVPGASAPRVDMGAYEHIPCTSMVFIIRDESGIRLIWNSVPGETYDVTSCYDLAGGLWNEEISLTSPRRAVNWIDPETGTSLDKLPGRKFYTVRPVASSSP